jgi:hypothetical protein
MKAPEPDRVFAGSVPELYERLLVARHSLIFG